MPGKTHVIVGGQYGSEAKGHVAAQISGLYNATHAVRVGGPNAGHTVIDEQKRRYALRTIPVAAAAPGCEHTDLVIAAGSEIDLPVLANEIETLEDAGHQVYHRLRIDPQATIIDDEHHQLERDGRFRDRIGSTAKGVGAARAARLLRTARLAQEIDWLAPYITDTATYLNESLLQASTTVVIEGTQGYGLGLHAGHYPYCTSGDCRSVDFLAQAGIHPRGEIDMTTWVVFRTYPIRVAGNSGPLHRETDWETLGARTAGYIQPEKTTVTQLVRRVGEWDPWLAEQAMAANGAPSLDTRAVLMFTDYLDPSLAGTTSRHALATSSAWPTIQEMERDLGGGFFWGYGTGPSTMIWERP